MLFIFSRDRSLFFEEVLYFFLETVLYFSRTFFIARERSLFIQTVLFFLKDVPYFFEDVLVLRSVAPPLNVLMI